MERQHHRTEKAAHRLTLSEQSTAEQFSTEAALLSGEDRFRQIFNFSDDAIFGITVKTAR
jgi:hypothetical protein